MLEQLRVRNLGVVDDVTVTFHPGLTVLTGETGAGKTLLIEALSLLLGGRADPTLVRSGSDEALVEGRFVGLPYSQNVEGAGTEDGETEIVLARSVVMGGRSKAWVDGRMTPLAALSSAGSTLLELHGQHEHRSLSHAASQREALDRYGRIDALKLQIAGSRLRKLREESALLGGEAAHRDREMDLVRHQVAEIEAAAVEDAGEDGRLAVEEDRLAAAAAYREAAASALEALSEAPMGSAVEKLAEASGVLAGLSPLAELETRVRGSMAEVADIATELRIVVETWEDDPERLEQIRIRRQQLHDLRRKYGPSLGEVITWAGVAREQLEALEAREDRARRLDVQITAAREDLAAEETRVADARRGVAPSLAAEIQSTLRTLAMPAARFEVSVEGDGPADEVTFMLGANPGEPLLPLAKAASGGELARTMLAVRLALSEAPGVLVFDEVDAGIGGLAATAVGTALSALGRVSQVLVVTHLAQVAARADHHLAVRKTEGGGRTRSEVVMLGPEERVVEVSRMLSGSPDSETARTHARELLAGGPDAGTATWP